MTNRFTVASRKLVSILAIVAMVIISISNISMENNVYAATTAQVGKYIVEVPDTATLPIITSSTTVTRIKSNTTTLSSRWYVVKGTLDLDKTITVKGDSNIILADGAVLKCSGTYEKAAIYVRKGYSLTIWNVVNGTGTIIAKGGYGAAGIGGNYEEYPGKITINGGTLKATGGDYAAGIGSGDYPDEDEDNSTDITINDGVVTGIGGMGAAGIGGGYRGLASNITINGGTVVAKGGMNTSDEGGAGIGGGYMYSCHDITINGGDVTAQGAAGAAAIGYGGNVSWYYIENESIDKAYNIKVADSLQVIGGINSDDTAVITGNDGDYTSSLSTAGGRIYYVHICDSWKKATAPDPTSIKSVKGLNKSIKVTWAKKSDVTGYQILYKTTKLKTNKYRVLTVKSGTTTSKTIKNLKKNTRYYIRVRTYSETTSNSSTWSKVKSVKTK